MEERRGESVMVESSLVHGEKPTKEQLEMIRAAADKPIIFDEDCPRLTEKQLLEFKRPEKRKFS